MKKVLMSIHPKWCEKIFNGSKTIEVRKTAPKIDTPFEVFVYQTKHKRGKSIITEVLNSVYGGGKVIGSFVCDKVDEYECHKGLTKFGGELGLPVGTIDTYFIFEDDYKAMCLSYDEVKAYGKGKTLSGLHITKPKLFDKPKELSEFYMPCKWYEKGDGCGDNNCPLYEVPDYEYGDVWHDCEGMKPLTCQPRSFCYVEDNK